LRWYAVNTNPQKEDFAARQLEAKGWEVFLPKITVVRKRGASKLSLWEPLFPGYLFVWLVPEPVNVRRVNRTPGVRRLLCAGDTPVPVPDEAVTLIRQRVGPRGHEPPKPQAEFPAGSRVAVRHGPFAGLLGVVEKPVTGRGRVRVLLELIQRQTAVEVDAVDLDRLGLCAGG
jgi:transcriptional antiterminator RfaH